jgi:hypothetical protein
MGKKSKPARKTEREKKRKGRNDPGKKGSRGREGEGGGMREKSKATKRERMRRFSTPWAPP